MKKLIIIGAGSVGGFIAYNFSLLEKEYELIGFLDDDPQKSERLLFGKPVLGKIDDAKDYRNCCFILGIAFPQIKKKIISRLSIYNLSFISYISDAAWISKNVHIGTGVIVYPGTTINYEVEIDDFVTVNMNCSIGHNCHLHSFSTLTPGVNLAGFSVCGECSELGIGASTRQHVRVESNAIVGGQSMVLGDVAANDIVVGVPASPIKKKSH